MKQYILLKLRVALTLLWKRKVTLRKLYNMARCNFAYWRRSLVSGRTPSIIFFELWNECNLRCVACRDVKGGIYDQNPDGDGSFVPKGKMPVEMYEEIVDQVKNDLLLAVLYVNGEPLLYKDLYRALRYATQRNLATMISTNAMPLTEKNTQMLLESGVDFIKIAVSGFTQETYKVYHRNGDIERVKSNIKHLADENRRLRSGALIMVDYIVFQHNMNEVALFRSFCEENGILFNDRTGITQGQDGVEHADGKGLQHVDTLCDWLWKILVVNWDGGLLPCCEYTTWKDASGYLTYQMGETDMLATWNGDKVRKYRKLHIDKGREVIPRCMDCHYKGTGLQA